MAAVPCIVGGSYTRNLVCKAQTGGKGPVVGCGSDCPPSCTGEAAEDAVQPTVGCAPSHLIKAVRDQTYTQEEQAQTGAGFNDWLSSIGLITGVLALFVAFRWKHNPRNPGHNPGNPIGEYKARQVSPGRFKRKRTIELTEGVSAVVGYPSGARKQPGKGRSKIQSLRFDPAIFSRESARRWARVHGFKSKLD